MYKRGWVLQISPFLLSKFIRREGDKKKVGDGGLVVMGSLEGDGGVPDLFREIPLFFTT